MRHSHSHAPGWLLGIAVLSGCSSGAHPRPSPTVQTAWQGAPTEVTIADAALAPQAWWQLFHDPALDELMQLGLQHNLDIAQASARVHQAQALRRAAGAALWPQLTLSGTDQFTHSPITPPGMPARDLEAAVNASWQVDLFGQLRNQRLAAQASLAAAQYDRDAVRVTLMSEIARNYVEFRLYQLQYAIASKSAESQAGTVRITQARFDQGASSRLDLERVQSQLSITRAALPQAREQAEASRATLVLLLATTPEALTAQLPSEVSDDASLPSGDPISVLMTPAQVIAQRPDVRSAQQQLASASANFRAAQAQRYPQLTLAGLFGTQGTEIDQLMRTSSRAWSYGGTLLSPLFDFGRIRAAIDLADAQQEQAYLTYEQTVRSALQATQTAIVMYAQGVLREQQLRAALQSAQTAARLARRQYQEGALSLLEVLDAERTAYDTELNWSQSAAAVSERLITLYQTMGVLPPSS